MGKWSYKKMGDICTIERGGSPRPIEQYITENSNGINWIKIGDASEDSMYITKTAQKIIHEGMKKSRYVKSGDFLLSNSMSFGRPYILKIDGCIHDGWLVLRDDNNIFDKRFLYYYLSAPVTYQKFKNMAVGGVVNNLNSDMVRKLNVPVPSMQEQIKISDVLDNIGNLIDKRKKQLEKLDELVNARFVELFGDPATNEKGWSVRDLESVTTIVTYGLTVRPEYISEGIDLVSARELHKGYVDYDSAPKIAENDFVKLSEKGKPQKNDILFSKTGSIGHCALVTEEKPFAITQNAARIGLKSGTVNPLWLLYYLRMDYIQDWCKDHAKGNAVKDFQLQDMKVIPLFDCPLEVQNQFAAFVEQTDKSKLIVKKSLDKLELLKKALMQKYFE